MLRDFDFAVDDYWDWFEARQNEQKPVPDSSGDGLPGGHHWGPKYDTLEEIFDKFEENIIGSAEIPVEDLIDQELLESEFGAFMADESDEDY